METLWGIGSLRFGAQLVVTWDPLPVLQAQSSKRKDVTGIWLSPGFCGWHIVTRFSLCMACLSSLLVFFRSAAECCIDPECNALTSLQTLCATLRGIAAPNLAMPWNDAYNTRIFRRLLRLSKPRISRFSVHYGLIFLRVYPVAVGFSDCPMPRKAPARAIAPSHSFSDADLLGVRSWVACNVFIWIVDCGRSCVI